MDKIRRRQGTLAALVVTASLLVGSHLAPVPVHASVWTNCVRMLGEMTIAGRLARERGVEHLPGLVEKYSSHWAAELRRRPEDLAGLTTEQAVELLESMKNRSLWGENVTTLRNPVWGNSVRIVSIAGQRVVLKTNQMRSSYTGERVVTFHNDVRYEVLAYALDRYLGTNLVPPAVLLGPGATATLFIPGRPTGIVRVAADPAHLMQVSHLRMLDLLLNNGDRGTPGNVVVGRGDQVVGIDFDLSRANDIYFGWTHLHEHLHTEVVVEPDRWLGRRASLPGVFARPVVDQLKALSRSDLVRIAGQAGLALSEYEIKCILGSAQQLILSIEKWKARYGEAQIVI